MRLQRWLQGRAKLQADRTESRTKDADIQRELSRLDAGLAAMRSDIATMKSVGSPWPGRLATEISHAGELAIGQAMDNFARALRRPAVPVRGRAGGLARAKDAWRCSDGTFMRDAEKDALIKEHEIEEYERYAGGGRARAASAQRAADGTFLKRGTF